MKMHLKLKHVKGREGLFMPLYRRIEVVLRELGCEATVTDDGTVRFHRGLDDVRRLLANLLGYRRALNEFVRKHGPDTPIGKVLEEFNRLSRSGQ